jgi:hypothetical protein
MWTYSAESKGVDPMPETTKRHDSAPDSAGKPVANLPLTEEQLRAVTIGEMAPLAGPIEIADYDPD